MSTTVKALVKEGVNNLFKSTTIERRDVGEKDVQIDIKFAGICHSDIHTALEHWGKIEFPIVPGHEIAGIVSAVGSGVTKYKVGDRVGVGCMVNSCGECENCKSGLEQYCLNGMTGTYADVNKYGVGERTQGGYSTGMVVDEDFAVRIPDQIELCDAAPLLCAAITTYSPLKHWNIGKKSKIAVLGLGELGHLGLKSAKALGAEVTILSHTPEKKDAAIEIGADAFYDMNNDQTFQKLKNQFDYILNTVPYKIDLNPFFSLLKLNGQVINVGMPGESYDINAFTMIGNRAGFAVSCIGGISETQEVLDFYAENNLRPQIEIIRGDQVNEAYEKVQNSEARFRYVIDTSTI